MIALLIVLGTVLAYFGIGFGAVKAITPSVASRCLSNIEVSKESCTYSMHSKYSELGNYYSCPYNYHKFDTTLDHTFIRKSKMKRELFFVQVFWPVALPILAWSISINNSIDKFDPALAKRREEELQSSIARLEAEVEEARQKELEA